eukprot:CAMPEP_0204012372 /NCGR_PEP_ID=MMETSP0360-20130528/23959_1 /ASSEMBLY_ACC=CAM_ASM_000342 /TAXON_ID=268821 /ORGANISM="Scrippsiella Hangoei, Strain SHTV-5" /LENGTH=74 /DNA_ID=CAMNT_0050955053 /DNA_START=39 /DNA_END=260 /DNA_ORIENTATION=-
MMSSIRPFVCDANRPTKSQAKIGGSSVSSPHCGRHRVWHFGAPQSVGWISSAQRAWRPSAVAALGGRKRPERSE